ADAGLGARCVDLVAHPGRLPAGGAHQGDVGHLDRHVLVDDAALLGGAGGALALAGDVHALADDLALAGQGTHDLALLALVLTGQDPDAVTLADLEAGHQMTSGASETIFMNRLSRSSRPTGPKMRVPRGLRSGLISTAAFSSKRM